MEKQTSVEFKRLYFKESKNKRGERCFISKQKESKVDGGNLGEGNDNDIIIVANVGVTPIDRAGRWTVTARKMFSGKGFIVEDATYCEDVVDMEVDFNSHKVSVIINGEVGRFKRVDKDANKKIFFIDLVYAPNRKGSSIEQLVSVLGEKEKFLQLPPYFSYANFIKDFAKTCEAIEKDYKAINYSYKIPNTPMAEALKKLKSK